MGRLGDRDSALRQQRELAGAPNAADFSEALARGLAVLGAFGEQRRAMTQAELARELKLSRATVRRAVLTLEHLGFLRAEGRSYQLSPRVLRLAEGYLTSNTISAVLQPVCDQICERLRESCSVAVLDGEDAVMVARAVPRRLIAAGSGVGYRVPAAQSALGSVLLAHLSDRLGGDGLGGDGLGGDRLGGDGLEVGGLAVGGLEVGGLEVGGLEVGGLAVEGLEVEGLEAVRREGYRYVANDVEAGFHSIAVPLRRWDGRVIAAMNVGCHIERLPAATMRGAVLDLLRGYADELRPQLI